LTDKGNADYDSFCMANAQTAHTLQHWKYDLYEWVVSHLRNTDELSSKKIVERDSWSTKKRRKYANDVTDTMVDNGTVKKLYQEFRGQIDAARDAKVRGCPRNH
jgi:hypothetical protein